jgi:hypothetical protein
VTEEGDTVEIDLMDAVRDVTGAKKTLLGAVILAILLAFLIAIFGHKSYTAQAELGPAQSSAQSGPNSPLNEISGAASLLGVTVNQPDDDFVKYKELLSSQRLADALYQNQSLRPIIFGAQWDAGRGEWQMPLGIGTAVRGVFNVAAGKPFWSPPGAFGVQNYLANKLNILTDKVTGYFKVSIAEDTPENATQLLRAIILTADDIVRQSVKNQAAARIAYLTKTLKTTTLQDERDTMINLLASQEKVLMLSSADKTYAVDIIDPPAADPQHPSPRLIAVLGIAIVLAVFIVILWSVVRGMFFVRGRRGYDPSLDAAVAAWLRRRKQKLLAARRAA